MVMDGIAIVLGIGLVFWAIQDMKNKKIMLLPITAAFAAGLLRCLIFHQPAVIDGLLGAGIGVALCLISKWTGKEIGMGDGMVTAVIGIYMGIRMTVLCLCLAFFLVSPVALLLGCFKKLSGKDSLPFLPFMLLGYWITWGINGGYS
jgi:prepilin signal peptidase PulO-like enzyme (type II secretory pathway)